MPGRQISVFLENKAGRLADVIGELSDRGFAIRGFSLADTTDYGIVRILTDRGEEAARALRARGFTTVETDVLWVDLKAAAGLADLLRLLGEACVNIEYLYLTAGGGVAMNVDRLGEVEAMLREKGYRLSA